MRASHFNPDPLPSSPDARNQVSADGKRRKRLRSLTASTLLVFYGYELLALPFAIAAQVDPAPATAAVAQESVYLLYVPQGEDLAQVAQRFGVEAASLSRLRQQAVSAGWSKQVWLVPKGTSGEALLYPGYVLHTLQPGESLGSLALRSNRSERELLRLNGQVLGNAALEQLKPGAQVVIPAPLAGSPGQSDAVAANDARAFEQRLAQTVSQAAQRYGAAQDSGQTTGSLLTQQAAGQASSTLSQGAEDLLNAYGRAKVGVRINSETENVELEFDFLHPWLENSDSILFSQLGGRRFDERYIGNLGVGYRQMLNPDLMLGANAFLDQDFTRDHNRAGVGVEAWSNTARLAANTYVPLSGWKRSHERHLNTDPERFELYERAAKGWDARGEALIPGLPQLAATARYFQWYGDGVDVFGGGQLEKDPKGYGLGLRWQPMPLLGFSAEHQQIQHGDKAWEVGMTLNWTFDRDLTKQLSTADSVALRPLAQARQDFVQRDYNVVLDYKQKEKPQDTPFAFASTQVTLQAPPLGAPNALTVNSPELQGVRSGAVVSYSLSSSARSASAAVSIDETTGVITVPPGASTQALTSTATQTLNGVVLGTASYNLQIQETLDTNAPAAPTFTVTDRNNDQKPEASGQAEAGDTVVVTWPDASSSSVIADGSGHWSVEAPTTQPSGNISAVANDASGNSSSSTSASWINLSAPVASNVQITGTAQVGDVLTGSYTYSDAENDPEGISRFQWYRGTTAIGGATQNSYTPVLADEGQLISFAVTPVAQTGSLLGTEAKSNPTGPVAGLPGAAPVASAVDINGNRVVGQVLTSSYSYSDADGDQQGVTTLQWNRGGAPIDGATAASYRLVAADMDQPVSVSITPVALTGEPKVGVPVQSSALQVVGNTDKFLQPDTVLRHSNEADAHCRSQGARLPTKAELQQLFVDATDATVAGGSEYNDQMCSLHNWPLSTLCGGSNNPSTDFYWTSDKNAGNGENDIVAMSNGQVFLGVASILSTACVR